LLPDKAPKRGCGGHGAGWPHTVVIYPDLGFQVAAGSRCWPFGHPGTL